MINPKDRHVVAAAIAAEAASVVTNDEVLRAEITASELAFAPLDGNAFAMRLWDAAPAEVGEVVDALIAKRRRHPVSAAVMAGQLGAHFPQMAEAWLSGLGHLYRTRGD